MAELKKITEQADIEIDKLFEARSDQEDDNRAMIRERLRAFDNARVMVELRVLNEHGSPVSLRMKRAVVVIRKPEALYVIVDKLNEALAGIDRTRLVGKGEKVGRG